jgi:hypothetical protein
VPLSIASLTDSKLSAEGPAGLHGSLGFPVINTSGGVSGTGLASYGQSQFASVGWDASKFVSQSTGIPLSGTANFGIGSVGYNLLDVDLGTSLTAKQAFSFTPIPMIELDASNGQKYTFAAGSTLDLTMPTTGDPLTFTPKFFLEDSFTEKTDLDVSGYVNVSALEADAPLD